MNRDYNSNIRKITKEDLNNINNQNEDLQQKDRNSIYLNRSPIYHRQHVNDEQNKIPYVRQKPFIQRQRKSPDNNDNKIHLEKYKKHSEEKDTLYFNDFNNMKDSIEGDINDTQNSLNNFTNQSPKIMPINNLQESQKEKQFVFKKKYRYQTYKEEEKYHPKFYIKNPLKNNNSEKTDNSNNAVAQKICNIIIKGEENNNKDNIGQKREKIIRKENDIRRNAHTPDKNKNINLKINYMPYDESNEEYENYINDNNKEIEFKKKGKAITLTDDKKRYDTSIKNREKEDYNEEYEDEFNNEEPDYPQRDEKEMDEDEENEEEYERNDRLGFKIKERKGLSKQVELLDDEDGQENIDERISDSDYEENNHRIKKGDIEELEEEEEIPQVNIQNINRIKQNNNYNLQLQKGNEKEINYMLEKVPIIQGYQSSNDKLRQNNYNNKYNIIKDDKVEIIGEKKPVVLEMNNESSLELRKEKQYPVIKIEKVQSLEQPRSRQKKMKKFIFDISKNKENNVDIIHEEEGENESLISIERVQNFQQPSNRKKKLINRKRNIQFKIVKIKDANFVLKKNTEEPQLQIEKSDNFEQIYHKKPIKRKKFANFKIVKIKDNNIDLIGIPNISICKENRIEIKNEFNNRKKRPKSNYKKYKISNRTTYQYKAIQIINDAIIIPKDSRFIIRGKPKKPKNVKNLIKREIIYFYKSPIYQKKKHYTIGGKIKNIINPTYNANNNYQNNNESRSQIQNLNKSTIIIKNRRISSTSQTNKVNKINPNQSQNLNLNTIKNLEKKEDNTEKKLERNGTYKSLAIFSSNLINSSPPQAAKLDISSIRKKYAISKSITNNIMSSPQTQKLSSNDKSRENILKTEYNRNTTNQRNHIVNIISPLKDEERNKNEKINENKKELGIRSKTGNTNFEMYNKNSLLKSENLSSGKTHTILVRRNDCKKKEIQRSPITKKNNNAISNMNKFYNTNTNRNNSHTYNSIYKDDNNKSHTITIISNDQAQKRFGRTYISSSKKNNKKIECSNDEKNNSSNIGNTYISNTHKATTNEKNNNQLDKRKMSSNSVNTIYITSNLKKDDKKDEKNETKKILSKNNNGYYSSSYLLKNNDTKKVLNNNQIYVSDKETNTKNENEIKSNINNTIMNYSSNSPTIVNNYINNNIISDNTEKENNTHYKTESLLDKKKDDDYRYNPSYKTSCIFNDFKIEKNINNNILDKYNINNNLGLSDITKSYLNKRIPAIRPELSDFSKQFLDSNIYDNYLSRPELSNITRAYLISQNSSS